MIICKILCQLGTLRANVYTLGATAFALFSDYDRSREAWPLDGKLYEVAIRAVNPDRNIRQQSIKEFRMEWEACKSYCRLEE